MKKHTLKRYLASLLAVLMLISVAGVSPAVFADWVTPPSLTNNGISLATARSGENVTLNGSSFNIRIPYNDDGTINFDTLYQRIFDTCVNTNKSTPKTRDQVEIKYYVAAVYVPLEGWVAYPAIKEGETHEVKFTYHYGYKNALSKSATCNITFLGRQELPGVPNMTVDATFKDDLSINYDALRSALWEQIKAQVTLPDSVKNSSVTFEYYYTYGSVYKNWVPFEGQGVVGDISIPAVACGNTYKVRLNWGGNSEYKDWHPEFNLTIVDGRTATDISFVSDPTVTLVFNESGIDNNAVKAAIWDVVASITPEDISKDIITVKYDGTDINSNPSYSEGTHTLSFSYAGSADYKPFSKDVGVTFVDNRIVAFSAKECPETLSRGYVGNELDEAKTIEKTREALVNKLSDVELSEIKVEYKFGSSYLPLDINGIHLHLTKVNKTAIRVSYAGDATHKPFSAVFEDLYFADNRVASSIEIKADASITYNMKADVMKQDIFDNVIDWDNSTLPAKDTLTVNDFKFECKAGLLKTYKDIGDGEYPLLDAGDGQTIRISFVGNSEYKPCNDKEATINVAKADVAVSMNKFTKAYAGVEDDLSIKNLGITLDPNDPRIDIYRIFAGINTNLKTSVNLVLTEDQWAFIEKISEVQAWLYDKAPKLFPSFDVTIKDKLEKGMTIGEFKEYMNNAIAAIEAAANDEKWGSVVQGGLELFNIDLEAIKTLASIFDTLTMLSDDTTIAVGLPQHAGLYRVYAIAANKNYNTNYASGTVLILMNWKNMKIVTDLKKATVSLEDAEKYASGELAVARLEYNGSADGIDQSSLHYRYTGLNTIYSSHYFPTKAGKYIVTVSVRGGDYYALPTTFTFTVK